MITILEQIANRLAQIELWEGDQYGCYPRAMTEQEIDKVAEAIAPLFEHERSALSALHDLTPGGSEFVNDTEACVSHVKTRMNEQQSKIIELIKENKELRK